MASDDIGGVWRTIGGRRVFIRTGTTLEQAMKESGKFKNLGKKVKNAKYDAEQKRKELLARAFAQYGDMSREDEDYLNSLKTYDELKSELKNRGWDDLLQEDNSKNKSTEDNEKFKEMYKSSYDAWKEANPQLSEKEIISILRAKQYNGELHADIKKGSQDNLVNQIKNYDNPGVLVDKWSAEEQFLARMKSGYDYAKEKEGKDKAEQYLKGVNVIEKSDDYLLYSMKNPNDGYTRYEISNSYDKNDRGKVEVFVEEDYSNGTIAGLSVNWSAIGSVDADTAKKFAEKINKAAAFADKAGKKVKGKKRWL